jgi:hypothetical protein
MRRDRIRVCTPAAPLWSVGLPSRPINVCTVKVFNAAIARHLLQTRNTSPHDRITLVIHSTRNPKEACGTNHPLVVAGELHAYSLSADELDGRQMDSVQCANWSRKRI